jgi:glucokinase
MTLSWPMSQADFDSPRLLADIGGTYARFCLETSTGVFTRSAQLRTADFPDFYSAVRHYLELLPPGHIQHAAVAIANPVEGDQVRMTNYHWQFSIEQVREQLQLETLVVVNDFTALAMALPRLSPTQRRQVGGGTIRERSVVGLLGAGSGLGVSGLIPADDGWVALGTEGGHASFAPQDGRELAILQFAWQRFNHVSFERLLSGAGMGVIFEALQHINGRPGEALSAPEITRRALDGSDPLCREAVDTFCAILGTAASNLAVTQGAFGGIYIGGGIVPRLGGYFDRSPFRARFEQKGRFSDYCAGIPTFVITEPQATFMGASAILARQVRAFESQQGPALLGQIRRSRASLSPAERRVADHVLAHPRTVLNDPIVEIARAAEVSQPTVIRFCRSLGCEGLSDFKLRLASGLTGTVPITHTQVTGEDSMLELGVKVLSNTASAILQVRDQLNREVIDRATDLLANATGVELYAVGQSAMVAQDAQFKFLRLGLPCAVHTDPRVQELAAVVMPANVVAIIISSSGRVPELVNVADRARERGAKVVAITASQSPLARKADVALIVDHAEDTSTQVTMISRILHLLVIDMLAVGLAMRHARPGEVGGTSPHAGVVSGTLRSAPGVSTASPLARMSSHSR